MFSSSFTSSNSVPLFAALRLVENSSVGDSELRGACLISCIVDSSCSDTAFGGRLLLNRDFRRCKTLWVQRDTAPCLDSIVDKLEVF